MILMRLGIDTVLVGALKKHVKQNEIVFEGYQKMDFILIVSCILCSLHKRQYESLKEMARCTFLINHHPSNIKSRTHLLQLLFDQNCLTPTSFRFLFAWLEVVGCSLYHNELKAYCKRHEIKIPEWDNLVLPLKERFSSPRYSATESISTAIAIRDGSTIDSQSLSLKSKPALPFPNSKSTLANSGGRKFDFTPSPTASYKYHDSTEHPVETSGLTAIVAAVRGPPNFEAVLVSSYQEKALGVVSVTSSHQFPINFKSDDSGDESNDERGNSTELHHPQSESSQEGREGKFHVDKWPSSNLPRSNEQMTNVVGINDDDASLMKTMDIDFSQIFRKIKNFFSKGPDHKALPPANSIESSKSSYLKEASGRSGRIDSIENTVPEVSISPKKFLEVSVSPKEIFQEMKGVFSDLTNLLVDSNGLIHHCSQYGVTLIIPEGAVQEKQTVTLHFGACLYSSKFKFGNYIPVTPIVWVYINQELMKPAELHLPHHVDATNPFTKSKLTLLTAKDEFFCENELHFTKNNDSVLEVGFAFCKASLSHFCSTCAAIEKSSFKDIQKRCRLAVAEKQKNDVTLLFHCIIFPSQLGCKKIIEEQYSQKDFILKFSFKEMNFGDDGVVSLIFDPDNLQTLGWTRSHHEIYVDDKILEDDVDYHKVMGCEDGDACSKKIDKLKDLEKYGLYPPRLCYEFTCMDRNAAQKVTKVIVTLQGSSVNFRHNINLKQPVYDPSKEIPNLLTPKDEDDISSHYFQSQLHLDSILLGCLEVIPSGFEECHHHQKWYPFGYTLGLSTSELHSIESRYRTPVQYARAILQLWREKNNEASLEPLTLALEKISLNDVATKLRHHFQGATKEIIKSQKIIEKIASNVLSKNIKLIAKSIKMADLANKMMERSIITRNTLESILNDRKSGLSDSERMSQLLEELINTVEFSGEIFSWFIQILKDYDTVASQKMAGILEEQYKEMCLSKP